MLLKILLYNVFEKQIMLHTQMRTGILPVMV